MAKDLGPDSHSSAPSRSFNCHLGETLHAVGCLCSPKSTRCPGSLPHKSSCPEGIPSNRGARLLPGVFEPRLPTLVPKWTSKGMPGLAEGCRNEAAEEWAGRRWEGVARPGDAPLSYMPHLFHPPPTPM